MGGARDIGKLKRVSEGKGFVRIKEKQEKEAEEKERKRGRVAEPR